ncbi:MAG TPA: isoprenylcysteine carboxylmethyltransferase family protein [Chitinophagaceae bacterium]|nr:isoprenylcysteine carboxylmethyltransferase family protein [Chitinophagaceae bacterium]
MNLIFLIVYSIWLVSEILINRLFRSGNADQQNADNNTLQIIWLTIALTMTLSVFISIYFHFPILRNDWIKYIGLLIIIAGCIFRFVSIISLGRYFTADVTIRQGHQLKTTGMYAYLRHPSYTASLLSFIGFGISLNNWLCVLIIAIAMTGAFSLRIKAEEKVLTTQFGEEYTDYKKKTFGLVPFIL